jgi:uncharacterized protein (TIGR03382 family)
MRRSSILLATLLAATAPPSIADACSPPACWPGYFTPADGATVPANLPAIYWRPVGANVGPAANDPTRVVLAAATDPTTPLAFTSTVQPDGDYLIVPTAPLVAGVTYTLTDHNICDGDQTSGPTTSFFVAPEAALPATLGTLADTDHLRYSFMVGTASGSCSAIVDGDRSTIALALSADALPWQDVLHYQTFVDGTLWSAQTSINDNTAPGSSWAGRGVDKIYDVCMSADSSVLDTGLQPGIHDVKITATVPGSTVALAAPDLSVELAVCPTPDPDDLGGQTESGCNASGGALGPLALVGLLLLLHGSRRRAVTRG